MDIWLKYICFVEYLTCFLIWTKYHSKPLSRIFSVFFWFFEIVKKNRRMRWASIYIDPIYYVFFSEHCKHQIANRVLSARSAGFRKNWDRRRRYWETKHRIADCKHSFVLTCIWKQLTRIWCWSDVEICAKLVLYDEWIIEDLIIAFWCDDNSFHS